jgi:hypothetical protein
VADKRRALSGESCARRPPAPAPPLPPCPVAARAQPKPSRGSCGSRAHYETEILAAARFKSRWDNLPVRPAADSDHGVWCGASWLYHQRETGKSRDLPAGKPARRNAGIQRLNPRQVRPSFVCRHMSEERQCCSAPVPRTFSVPRVVSFNERNLCPVQRGSNNFDTSIQNHGRYDRNPAALQPASMAFSPPNPY